MVYCKYCYRMLEDGTEICTACGKPLHRKGIVSKVLSFFRNSDEEAVSSSPEPSNEPVITAVEPYMPAKKAELCQHDKEEVMVRRVTSEDMKQFTSLPFVWNSEIKKVMGPSTKPYAYIDIIGANIDIAKEELSEMNLELVGSHILSNYLPRGLEIPIWDIVFTPQSGKGYSKIVCTPYTFTGRISKYPAHLLFMTDFLLDRDSTHGELFYNQCGSVEKAKICFWRNREGYFFYFKTVNQKLVIDKIESTVVADVNRASGIIYKAPL